VRHDGAPAQEDQRSYRKPPRDFHGKPERFKGKRSEGGEGPRPEWRGEARNEGPRPERRGKPKR